MLLLSAIPAHTKIVDRIPLIIGRKKGPKKTYLPPGRDVPVFLDKNEFFRCSYS